MDRKLQSLFEHRRKVAELNHELLMKKINQKFPELKTFELNLGKLYKDLAILTIKNQDTTKIEKEIQKLKNRKSIFMKENEIEEEFLRIRYLCCSCKDTGYLQTENGRIKCECLKKEEAQQLYMNSNMLSNLEKENFETFDLNVFDDKQIKYDDKLTSHKDHMSKMLKMAKTYVSKFDSLNGKGLIFYGGVGLGKSFLCSSIGKALLDEGKTVVYYTSHDLFKLLSQYTFNRSNFLDNFSYSDYNNLDNVDLLIIDDLGAELTNSFTLSELFNIINSRIIKEKSTIMSTNLDIGQLEERYGERLYSRFSMYFSFYEFIGEDVRWKL